MILVYNSHWNKLSPEHQKIVKESFDEGLAKQRKLIFENDKTLRKKMEEAGVKFIDLPDAELARWKDATKTVGEKVKDIIPLEKQERIKSLIK